MAFSLDAFLAFQGVGLPHLPLGLRLDDLEPIPLHSAAGDHRRVPVSTQRWISELFIKGLLQLWADSRTPAIDARDGRS